MVFHPPADADSRQAGATVRYQWLTPVRQTQLRGVLLGITLFFGLAVWVWHSLGSANASPNAFVGKLRVVGIMTWLYALVQLVDSLRHCPVFTPAQGVWFRCKALEVATHVFFRPPGGEMFCTRAQRAARDRVARSRFITR